MLSRTVVVAYLLGLPRPTFGQTPGDEARAAFRVGAQAFRANQFATAARSFEEAYERDPRPETAFSIAQANRRQYYLDRIPWRVQRAVQLYQAYLDKLPAGPRANDAADRLGELEPILRELRTRGEIVPYVPPARTELVIGAEIDDMTATVEVDGRTAALWEPISVTPGSHDVVVAAPGYEIERRRIVAAEGRFLAIDVTLRPKPARLLVQAESGATLYIDGRRIGTLPKDASLVAAGKHFVSVTHRGRRTFSREVVLRRDESLRVAVDLETTDQRRAARWVLAGAGALAAASAGVAVWAYGARRDARDLDDKRRMLGATPADLAAYNERVETAQSRASWSLGIGVAALATGVVGAGLLWFDSPGPGESPRTVEPIVGNDTVGVSFTGSF